MNDELREPPRDPIWASPHEIYIAQHPQEWMTNLVIVFGEQAWTDRPPDVVVPLSPNEVVHLAQLLGQRLKALSEFLEEDQATDDLTW